MEVGGGEGSVAVAVQQGGAGSEECGGPLPQDDVPHAERGRGGEHADEEAEEPLRRGSAWSHGGRAAGQQGSRVAGQQGSRVAGWQGGGRRASVDRASSGTVAGQQGSRVAG